MSAYRIWLTNVVRQMKEVLDALEGVHSELTVLLWLIEKRPTEKSVACPPITRVAIQFRGKVWSLPKPNRHHDVIRLIVERTGVRYVDAGSDQGFLDESGRYLTREQALVSAKANGQLKDPTRIRCGMLFSEDLW